MTFLTEFGNWVCSAVLGSREATVGMKIGIASFLQRNVTDALGRHKDSNALETK